MSSTCGKPESNPRPSDWWATALPDEKRLFEMRVCYNTRMLNSIKISRKTLDAVFDTMEGKIINKKGVKCFIKKDSVDL